MQPATELLADTKKIPAEGNGQGRTAVAADAFQASCGARLYLSKGLLPLACWRVVEKGEMPSVCNFFSMAQVELK
jgi:hypothetical protein